MIFYSASHQGFFDPDLHQLPEDAVPITARRHAQLLRGQDEGGQIVPGKDGLPQIEGLKPAVADLRKAAIRQTKREASRRITAISPVWRQMNDLRDPSAEAQARFAALDAVRAASALIEAQAAKLSAARLAEFDIAHHPFWPEFH